MSKRLQVLCGLVSVPLLLGAGAAASRPPAPACAQWEVLKINPDGNQWTWYREADGGLSGRTVVIPEGWEPVAGQGSNELLLRRCLR
jgi:hypothetical protein